MATRSDQSALKLFISYSRRDAAAADALVEDLETEDFEVTIDRRDLPFGEEWRAQLAEFIRDADTILWLISPASISSDWVNWEVGEVQRAGKRLIPVVIASVLPESLPKAIGVIHLLPAEGVYRREDHLQALVDALKTDHAWIKAHSRLGERARDWISAGRRNDRLLRGSALASAEEWRSDRPEGAPAPTAEILELMAASERAAKRRLRTWIAASVAITLGAVTLSLVAIYQRGVAENRLVQQLVDRGEREIADGDLQNAWLWFAEALVADRRGGATEAAHRRRLDAVRVQLPELVFHAETPVEGAMGVMFSPDVKSIAVIGDPIAITPLVSGAAWPEMSISFDHCSPRDAVFSDDQTQAFLLAVNCYSEKARSLELMRMVPKDGGGATELWRRSFPDSTSVTLSGDGHRALLVPPVDKDGPRSAIILNATTGDVIAEFSFVTDDGYPRVAFSRDASVAAVMVKERLILNALDDAVERLRWEATDTRSIEIDDGKSMLAVSADGSYAAVGSDKMLEVWTLASFERTMSQTYDQQLIDINFSPDRCGLATTVSREDRSRYTELWNVCGTQKAVLERVIDHETKLEQWRRDLARGAAAGAATVAGASAINWFERDALYGPDGEAIATVSDQRDSIRLWRRTDGFAITPELVLFGGSKPNLTISPDGRAIACVDYQGRLRIWRLDTIRHALPLTPIQNRIDALFYTPSGEELIAAFYEGTKAIWRVTAGSRADREFSTWSNDTRSVVYDERNHRLISGGFDDEVFVWDIAAGDLATPKLRGFERVIGPIAIDAAGELLAVQSAEDDVSMIRLFALPSGRPLTDATPLKGTLVALRPDGAQALISTEAGFSLVDPLTWRQTIGPLPAGEDYREARYLDEGRSILLLGARGFQRFSSETGEPLAPPVPNRSTMTSGLRAISEDARYVLAQGRLNESVQVIDVETGQPVSPPLEHSEYVRVSGFAAGGAIVYTSTARLLFLWDAASGDLLGPPLRHDNDINEVAIDPSAEHMAVALSTFGSSASASSSGLVQWTLGATIEDAGNLRVIAELNSGRTLDASRGSAPLQPDAFGARWREASSAGLVGWRSARDLSDWRVTALRRAGSDFSRDFHLTWARRERIEDPEVLLQTLDHGNSRDNPARLTLLDEVIAKGRAHYSVLLARASELARQSRWREAIDAYRAALAVRRDDPSVWYSLSTALVAAGTPQEQNDFCSEMFDTFFKNEIHGNSWNLVAGSCAYFRGKIDVRPALIDLVADAAPSAKGRYDANADFYSLMLFRERGVDAVASRLSINENSFATIALKAIHLAKHDDAAAAQEQIDVILDNLARRKESSDLYDRLRASDRLRIDSLLQDAAAVGLRITRAEQGDRSEQHGNRTETQDPQP